MDSQIQQDVQEFQAGTERVRREIEEAGSRLSKRAGGAWDDVVDLIRDHPAQAVGIALAAGVAAGMLSAGLSRRRISASDNLRELAGTGTEAWGKIRNGFDEALGTMKEAFDDAVAKFK